MAIEIVDLPIKNCDFPSFFVCLPGRVAMSRCVARAFDGREDILGGGSSGLQSPAGYSREGDAEYGAPRKRDMKGI